MLIKNSQFLCLQIYRSTGVGILPGLDLYFIKWAYVKLSNKNVLELENTSDNCILNFFEKNDGKIFIFRFFWKNK